jgi:energy-coupling factor transporter ATP-binding protein EcfA2
MLCMRQLTQCATIGQLENTLTKKCLLGANILAPRVQAARKAQMITNPVDIDYQPGVSAKGLRTLNVLLGKNGCGKSTVLKQLEVLGDLSSGSWGLRRYITPERGGVLVLEPNIERHMIQDTGWMASSRRANAQAQFRQQSIAQYRRLELSVLREFQESQEVKFQTHIDRINSLLENIEIRTPGNTTDASFKIYSRTSGGEVDANVISSGESELISLAIECLVYAQEVQPGVENLGAVKRPLQRPQRRPRRASSS